MLARKLLLLYCRACEDRHNFMLPGSMFMGVPGVHILASNVGIHLNIVRVIVRTYEWDSVIWWHLPQGTWCVLFMHWGRWVALIHPLFHLRLYGNDSRDWS